MGGLSSTRSERGGNDTLVSIEHVVGSSFDDDLGSNAPSAGGFMFDGGAGNDSIMGGSGVGGLWTNPNVLNGGTGDDRIQGGEAITNFLNGGAGADTINFTNSGFNIVQYQSVDDSPAGVGRDTIVHTWPGDLITGLIDLREIDANTTESGNQDFVWDGPFTAGHLRYAGNVLQGNTDADAAAEFEIAMVLYGGEPLTPVGAGLDILL